MLADPMVFSDRISKIAKKKKNPNPLNLTVEISSYFMSPALHSISASLRRTLVPTGLY